VTNFFRGSIVASRTPGGNVTIDTTHTTGGLIRSTGPQPRIEIQGADLDDAISALQALRDGRAGPAPMMCAGMFRVYFNRHGAAPLVWCVATEHWELAVAAVSIQTAAGTRYEPKATPDNEDGRTSAWIVTTGMLTVTGGEAVITGVDEPQVAER
jgi:hypothetical protein